MVSDRGESSSGPTQTPGLNDSSSSNNSKSNSDAGDFECNICFDLPEDPIVTLCGHLFCWACLYRWLHHHSLCQECPVCKALVQEDKLVPLYGRGKTQTDPRTKPLPGVVIPRRPMGQRPRTANANANANADADADADAAAGGFSNFSFGLMGGFVPMATARFGSFAVSAGFGGLVPSMFNVQVHGYPNAAGYGSAHGMPHGFHGARVPGNRDMSQGDRENSVLKNICIVIGILLIFSLIFG